MTLQGANSAGSNLRINADRLWRSIHEMAEISPGIAGGSNRQAATDGDGQARKLLQAWCEDAGLVMAVDQMGTMFLTRQGTDPDALPVYVGSHLDTQPTGGRYDGVLGVLAALEIARSLDDQDIKTRHPIVVTNWTNEEGTRFAPAMMASGVFAGAFSQDWAYSRTDAQGMTFGDELSRIGWRGEEDVGARDMHAFFELHIEQGPILEAEGKDIGVVTHAQGQRWIECTISGTEAHAGSTPMPNRRDAARGLAALIDLVNRVALDNAPNAVGTIGHIDVYPNSRNVIAGGITCTIDIRSHEVERLDAMVAQLGREAPKTCASLGLEFSSKIVGQYDPPAFDPALCQSIRDAADSLGLAHRDIISGAGHDACHITKVAPTAMIFCPCVDGLSHNEAEEITQDWAAAGANVLLHAVLNAAGIEGR